MGSESKEARRFGRQFHRCQEADMATQHFFFDMKDGVPVRDRIGMQFSLGSQAIEHSKNLAAQFRHERIHEEPDLVICVVDESGREIHRELVHPMVPT
jgi:hypothetical protein